MATDAQRTLTVTVVGAKGDSLLIAEGHAKQRDRLEVKRIVIILVA